MKLPPTVEFNLLDCGTPELVLNGIEVSWASALNEYAHLFLDPKHDHDRIAGWLLAKTGKTVPLKCQSHAGIGWDISVGILGGPRMLIMRRHYLYAKNEDAHIADRWSRFSSMGQYLDQYLMQLNPCLGDPGELNYYVTDSGPRFPGQLGSGNDMLVVRNAEGNETRFDAEGNINVTSVEFSVLNRGTTTYFC